jgi:hypothetical protein
MVPPETVIALASAAGIAFANYKLTQRGANKGSQAGAYSALNGTAEAVKRIEANQGRQEERHNRLEDKFDARGIVIDQIGERTTRIESQMTGCPLFQQPDPCLPVRAKRPPKRPR